jgi:hypothetical protein
MSNDPPARSDILSGAPDDTEYDAIYAAVTATERGRWFLTEFAMRSRHAESALRVSEHPLSDAVAPIAEVTAPPRPPIANVAPAQANSRSHSRDPLADMRSLSEEELIALFG